MAKSFYNRRNANGEEEIIERDNETGQETIFRTTETKESKIRKAQLLTIEDVRNLLLELFK